jgi:cytochrome c-type biogenesis protein CcmH/NrfG
VDEPTEAANPFHDVIAARRPVPRFEPLEGAGQVPGLGEDPQTRRRSRRRRRSATRKYANDRRQTLILVAVILAVIVLGVLYATLSSADEPTDQKIPSQGAPGWPTMTR